VIGLHAQPLVVVDGNNVNAILQRTQGVAVVSWPSHWCKLNHATNNVVNEHASTILTRTGHLVMLWMVSRSTDYITLRTMLVSLLSSTLVPLLVAPRPVDIHIVLVKSELITLAVLALIRSNNVNVLSNVQLIV
jgi:hypothetical protein